MMTEVKLAEFFEKITNAMEVKLKEVEAKEKDNVSIDDRVMIGMLFGMLLTIAKVLELDSEMKEVFDHIEAAMKVQGALDAIKLLRKEG
jgi:hypothetical protein